MTQTFQPIINIHSSVASSVEPVSREQPKRDGSSPAKPVPNFEYRGHREKAVFISPYALSGIHDPHGLQESEHATEALVLRFENEPRGTMTARAMVSKSTTETLPSEATRAQRPDGEVLSKS